MRLQRGFTIIELMVSITVFAVMAVVAIPSFVGFVDRSRTVTSANSFLNVLMVARSEAIRRNRDVTVCNADATGTACEINPVLALQWESGLIVFDDVDADNVADANEIILIEEGVPNGFTFREVGTTFGASLDYSPSGETFPVTGGTVIFNLCRADGDTAKSRRINISAAGRPAVAKTASVCP